MLYQAELRAHILEFSDVRTEIYGPSFVCLNIFCEYEKIKKINGGDPAAGSPTATL